MKKSILLIIAFLGLLLLLDGCRSVKTTVVTDGDLLSVERQREFDYYFLCANNLKLQQKYDAAFDMYEHCLSINPNSPAVLYELSQFYLFLNRKEKVEQMLESVVAARPDNYWYRQTLAAVYQQNGKVDKTIALYEDMAQKYPAKVDILMGLVDLYAENKQYGEAIKILDKLEKIDGKNEQISMQKFKMYVGLDDYSAAFAEMEELAAEYPNDLRYEILLGDLYLKNDKTQEAYKTYQDVLSKEPDNALAQLSMVSYYETVGNDSLRQLQIEKLLMNDKLQSETRAAIMKRVVAEDERDGRDSTRVMLLFDKMLQGEQKNADMLSLYAEYLIYKKANENSISKVLSRILTVEPDNKIAQLQLVQYAINHDDYDKIIDLCEVALQYNPDIVQLYYFLGISYYQKKQNDKALDALKKGVEQKQAETRNELIGHMYEIIGELYHDMDDFEAAYAALDSALVYVPDDILTLNNYAYYLSLKKVQLDKAEEMSYKTIQKEPTNSTYLDTYAWILFQKGRYAEAKIYMDNCMKNGGEENAVELEHCGDIYYFCGDTAQAVEYWKRAYLLDDSSKTLKKKIQQKKYIE